MFAVEDIDMNKVLVDKTMRSKLRNCKAELELCDESGRTVGFFVPSRGGHVPLPPGMAQTLFTDEELEAARNEPGGVSTKELLAYLESLAPASPARKSRRPLTSSDPARKRAPRSIRAKRVKNRSRK